MRLLALRTIIAIVSLVSLAAATPCLGQESEQPAISEKTSPVTLPTLKLAKKAPDTTAQSDDLAAAVEDETAEEAQPSHRRGAEKKKAARAIADGAVIPIERLQELCGDDVVLQPIIVRSTLADAMRRVALWGDCCPICGCAPSGKDHKQADPRHAHTPLPRQHVLNVEDAEPAREPPPAPLRAGEPAQVILDTQKRLGKSATDGTEFGGSPELLIQWIRILDEENRRRQLTPPDVDRQEPVEPSDGDPSVTARSQVEALRQACHQLQEAADLLEEQNLFESADSLRGIADVLRRQSRHKLSAGGPPDEAPLSHPRHARAKANSAAETAN